MFLNYDHTSYTSNPITKYIMQIFSNLTPFLIRTEVVVGYILHRWINISGFKDISWWHGFLHHGQFLLSVLIQSHIWYARVFWSHYRFSNTSTRWICSVSSSRGYSTVTNFICYNFSNSISILLINSVMFNKMIT